MPIAAPSAPAVDVARVLLVEDTAALARTYIGYLRDDPYQISHADTLAAARRLLAEQSFDVVLLDLHLPDGNGMDLLKAQSATEDSPPILVITAQGSIGAAVEAMRVGAADFLVKPFGADRLSGALGAAVEKLRFSQAIKAERAGAAPIPPIPGGASASKDEFHGFIGSSLAMQASYRAIERAAKSNATVFITGESGSGKEVAAHAVHAESPRTQKPFIAINCAAIPGELMESEIFGHMRGSFTGAVSDKMGAAKAASGGTLFLDEICEMSPHLQTKLLRFIQTGTFNPVGSTKLETVDVRFICATNRDPLDEIAAGRFREDLYYRLHVIPVALPPLRDRGDDVLRIARELMVRYAAEEGKDFASFAPDACDALTAYDWPGNVRQLQNVLRNAVVLNDGVELTADMLPPPVTPAPGGAKAPARPRPGSAPAEATANDLTALSQAIRPLAEIEREAIEQAVKLCGGDVRKAAVFLGVSAATIYRKQKTWREED